MGPSSSPKDTTLYVDLDLRLGDVRVVPRKWRTECPLTQGIRAHHTPWPSLPAHLKGLRLVQDPVGVDFRRGGAEWWDLWGLSPAARAALVTVLVVLTLLVVLTEHDVDGVCSWTDAAQCHPNEVNFLYFCPTVHHCETAQCSQGSA